MGFLRQNVGTLAKASDVVLTFDVSEPWAAGAVLNAAILDGNFVPLAGGDFSAGAKQTLVAKQVPAGTSIIIAFQAAKLTPGLDNVSVAVKELDSSAPAAAPPPVESGPRITVASYYFGNYHPGDPRNAKNKGPDWSEWELVKAARPRFPGHHQPNVPLWGYADESDPKVMAQKIAAAADHGIDAFIFDWYYYNDGPFLDRPIDLGFLQGREQRPPQVRLHVGQSRLAGDPTLQARHGAEAALSRHGDAGELSRRSATTSSGPTSSIRPTGGSTAGPTSRSTT